MINSLHLNILSNFAEIGKFLVKNELEDSNIILLAKDLGAFYKSASQEENISKQKKDKYYENYLDFKKKKLTEIELQEIIMRIGANVTKSENCCIYLLYNTYFFDDIIQFLQGMIPTLTGNQKDFIEIVIERKKLKDPDSIRKLITSILENAVIILFQSISIEQNFLEYFIEKVL